MSADDSVDEGLGDDAKKLLRKFNANKQTVDKDDLVEMIEERSKQRATFLRLPFTVLFFVSFALFALGHEHIGDSSLVQREIRGMLSGTTYEGVWATSGHKDMSDIDTKEDIYNYLKEAIVPLFITPIATPNNERHRALRYNRVVGGVVLQQVRRKTVECKDEYEKLGPFTTQTIDGGSGGKVNPILHGFDCYPWNTEADDCFGPPSTTPREGFCPDSKVFEAADASTRRLDFVPDGGGTGGSSKGKYPAPANRSYYSVYLYEYEGLETALQKLNTLETDGWIDYNTAWLGVRILVLNPSLQIFVHSTINVYMPPSGAMLPKVTAQSFQPEPYISKSVLAIDALYAFCVIALTVMTLREFMHALKEERCKAYFKDAWNWLDLLVVMTSLMVGMLWVVLLGLLDKTKKMAMDAREAEPLPGQTSDTYPRLVADMHVQMNEAAGYLNTWRLVLCWYTLLISLKFLESFASQPRLAVVTKTILRAGPDFFHFFIVCMLVFFAFVVSGMFLFGRRLWNWSNYSLAANEAFLLMMGDFDYDELTADDPLTAGIWFALFICLGMLLLLNMLMAIIMDVYTEIKGEVASTATLWGQLANIGQDYVDIIMGKRVSDSELLKVLRDAPEDDLDVDLLMNRVGPGLAREQADAMIAEVVAGVDERLHGSVNMVEAIRMIAWVKIAVQRIHTKLEDLMVAERAEKASMLAASKGEAVNGTTNGHDGAPIGLEDDPSAYLAQTTSKINSVEQRLRGLEVGLQESIGFTSARGKDLRDRLQIIEDLIRGQRDAMVRRDQDIWNPRSQHMIQG